MRPYAVVFHDILNDEEINYLIDQSRPQLSRSRYDTEDISDAQARHEYSEAGSKVKIVHKTGFNLIYILSQT